MNNYVPVGHHPDVLAQANQIRQQLKKELLANPQFSNVTVNVNFNFNFNGITEKVDVKTMINYGE